LPLQACFGLSKARGAVGAGGCYARSCCGFDLPSYYEVKQGSEDTHLRAVLPVSISQVNGLREKLRCVQLTAGRRGEFSDSKTGEAHPANSTGRLTRRGKSDSLDPG